MPTLAQTLGAQLNAKRQEIDKFFTDHKITEEPLVKADEDWITSAHAEINDLAEKWEKARKLEGIQAKNRELGAELAKIQRPEIAMDPLHQGEVKSLGQVVTGMMYQDGSPIRDREMDEKNWGLMELKTTMTTAAGWDPATIRSSRTELIPMRAPMLADILPIITMTTGDTYQYMQETTFTNNAAQAAENADYVESALAYTPVDAVVRKTGTFIPVTEEQLMDVPGMSQLIDARLATMVNLALDQSLLTGDGNAPNIKGFYSHVTQTYALSGEPAFDAIYRGMNKVRTLGFANPDAVVVHPNDFVDIRLARTEEGIYIMGNPDVVGSERLFGLRVVQTTAATENTALVGDFGTYSALITRSGLSVEIKKTDSHASLFIRDVWTIKARVRAALAVFRILAFCEVTGI